MFKKLFAFIIVIGILVVIWFTFAFWTGIYSVYSIAPSPPDNLGATYVVSREEGEPLFNSPEYVPPAPKASDEDGKGMQFSTIAAARRPIKARTIVKLPYIDWAYQKSIENPDSTK